MQRHRPASLQGHDRKSPRLSFLCPDHDEPSGGVRVIYRHVDRLNALGFSAQVVHMQQGFRCSWFDNRTTITYAAEFSANPSRDVLVIPEVYGRGIAQIGPGVPRVIFNQNAFNTFTSFPPVGSSDEPRPYLDASVLGVITVSEHNRDYVQYAFPAAHVHRVRYSVDLDLFEPASLKLPQLAYMPRRQADDLHQVLSILASRGALNGIELVPIDGVSAPDVARLLSTAQFFLSAPIAEGFGLPGIEAMASGCAVVGYHGFGGREFLLPGYAFPVEFGDVLSFAMTVESALETWRSSPEEIAAIGVKARQLVQETHSQNHEDEDLVRVWSDLLERRERHLREEARSPRV